ncbi:hypothetical protein BU23DRAFT_560476 [Bimuria novae-zelandiae CBS 107.79]|uniref:Uncharacterized protein n=1 Tax=Bimuria novae-zelandiae CBS 107.79 TaxID=1447943 RepID=A0A6A5ULP0_9PLEO|nr:hypothetical protein BU23DRAFT_560476 [Bimuria novae-zelandiae CBS 107.79]
MPIKPDTAASHLMYLCDSPLPELFKELGGQGTKERDQIIEQMGLRYAMGYSSSSGVDRLAVLTMGGANVSWH